MQIATDTWTTGSQGGAWGDYDNDGLQDLYAADNYGTSDRLYHNNGDGTFINVNNFLRSRGSAYLGGSLG